MRSMGLRRMARRAVTQFSFGLPHRVAALVEGVREEVRQKAALGIFHARNIADKAQRAAIAHAAHHGIQANAF